MNDTPGRAGMALVAAALYLLVCLFVAGLGYVLHLIAGFVWHGSPSLGPYDCTPCQLPTGYKADHWTACRPSPKETS